MRTKLVDERKLHVVAIIEREGGQRDIRAFFTRQQAELYALQLLRNGSAVFIHEDLVLGGGPFAVEADD